MTDEKIQADVEVVDSIKDTEWHRAEGRCKRCNLKGYVKVAKDVKAKTFVHVPCDCLHKTLNKKGIGNDVEFKLVTLEHIPTLIARVRPPSKSETTPVVYSNTTVV